MINCSLRGVISWNFLRIIEHFTDWQPAAWVKNRRNIVFNILFFNFFYLFAGKSRNQDLLANFLNYRLVGMLPRKVFIGTQWKDIQHRSRIKQNLFLLTLQIHHECIIFFLIMLQISLNFHINEKFAWIIIVFGVFRF